jgi:hypothetical protein
MSIWLLIIFAISMSAGVVSSVCPANVARVAEPVFLLALATFLAGVVLRGIRRPVV